MTGGTHWWLNLGGNNIERDIIVICIGRSSFDNLFLLATNFDIMKFEKFF